MPTPDYDTLTRDEFHRNRDIIHAELAQMQEWRMNHPQFLGDSLLDHIQDLYQSTLNIHNSPAKYSATTAYADKKMIADLQSINAALVSRSAENLQRLYDRSQKPTLGVNLDTKVAISEGLSRLYAIAIIPAVILTPASHFGFILLSVFAEIINSTDNDSRKNTPNEPWRLQASRNRMFGLAKKLDEESVLNPLVAPRYAAVPVERSDIADSDYSRRVADIHRSQGTQLYHELSELGDWQFRHPDFAGIETVKRIHDLYRNSMSDRADTIAYTPEKFAIDSSIIKDLKAVNLALRTPTQENINALKIRSVKPSMGIHADTKMRLGALGVGLGMLACLSSIILLAAFPPAALPVMLTGIATMFSLAFLANSKTRNPKQNMWQHTGALNRMFTLAKGMEKDLEPAPIPAGTPRMVAAS